MKFGIYGFNRNPPAIRLLTAFLLALASAPSLAATKITVKGNERISSDTVVAYAEAPDKTTPESIDAIVKRLYATGLFADVSVARESGGLLIAIKENPSVNRVYFDGNDKVEDDVLLKAGLQLAEREMFTRAKAKADADRIAQVYRSRGMYAAEVAPKVIEREQNRVDVVFEIKEGAKAYIKDVRFIGNAKFSDGELRDAIVSREEAWWRFFSSVDTYDADRFAYDQEMLRRFYLSRGYADFSIQSAVAELTPGRDGFVLTFTVAEGDRYRVGRISVTSQIPDLPTDGLRDAVTLDEGGWYDASQIDKSVAAISDKAGAAGYAFVTALPDTVNDRDSRTVNVSFAVAESQKVFVNRINITGNVRTEDKVIRREFRIGEGDAFNAAKIRDSKRRIEDLDFFSKVMLNSAPVPGSPDKVDLNMEVEEKSTGALTFNVGWSTLNGPLFGVGLQENNLLGTARQVGIKTAFGTESTQFDVSLTEPYFMDREILAGIDLFYTTQDYSNWRSYSLDTTGGRFRLGWRYNDNWRHTASYSLRRDKVTDINPGASIYVKDREGASILSMASSTLSYDTRDSRLFPTSGVYATLSNDIAGIGGDRSFFRTDVKGIRYYPVADGWTFSAMLGAGYMSSLNGKDVTLTDRYYLGGYDVRGFDAYGIGAHDRASRDGLGGNWNVQGTLELTVPLGLPKEIGMTGRIFNDWGVIGKPDGFNANTMVYSNKPRSSVGAGIGWQSPLGYISLDFGWAWLKEEYDDTEVFRLNFGSRF